MKLTLKEVSEKHHFNYRCIRSIIDKNKIPSEKNIKGERIIEEDDLLDYFALPSFPYFLDINFLHYQFHVSVNELRDAISVGEISAIKKKGRWYVYYYDWNRFAQCHGFPFTGGKEECIIELKFLSERNLPIEGIIDFIRISMEFKKTNIFFDIGGKHFCSFGNFSILDLLNADSGNDGKIKIKAYGPYSKNIIEKFKIVPPLS